ncbi:5-oxoprolinase subunit PxpA [uncultured Bifidobacterium sp.]|uniref:LamB/YcsF family protein n=1 Tax=uncultured Bifidobacterium sp. TaxID=165187 RepID=UPI00263119C3|nr:5-oxoprolinase subunit PxpA [uncultured Bifidobacterium sp.]
MQVDLNSDMGEGFGRWSLGDDAALLSVVSSANVACGFHAGDPSVMLSTLGLAEKNGVSVGAHVSYRDLAGFGRRFMDVGADELTADVIYQLSAIRGMADSVGVDVGYVKPHGALYNRIAVDPVQARAVVAAILRVDPSMSLLTLPGSVVGDIAGKWGLRVVHEAFADRAYTPQGALVSRRLPGSVITDVDQVSFRVSRMVRDGVVTAVDGSDIPIRADSVCVHGDSPGAVAMARAVRDRLLADGVEIRPFVRADESPDGESRCDESRSGE